MTQRKTKKIPSPIFLDDDHGIDQPCIVNTRTKNKKLIAFGWYGGKFSHLDWILPLLPRCHHYCEPFAGSGAVLINRPPSPVETYNDTDGEVVNFFR
jgi:DNA adenine methylase